MEEILENMEKQSKKIIFNYEYTDKLFHKKYIILENYTLINPYNLAINIKSGDIIRYIKNIDYKLSCAALVISIEYKIDPTTRVPDKTLIDGITLLANGYKIEKKYWNIWPGQYYIFKYVNPKKKQTKNYFVEKIHKTKINLENNLHDL